MKKSTIKITVNPNTGEVFTLNKNEDGSVKLGKDGERWGSYRLEQICMDFSQAIPRPIPRSVLKPISEKSYLLAKDFLIEGTEISGNLFIKETLEKTEYAREKRAGKEEDAPICSVNGSPIYISTIFSEDPNETDVLIQHDNTEEIKAYVASKKVANTSKIGALN